MEFDKNLDFFSHVSNSVIACKVMLFRIMYALIMKVGTFLEKSSLLMKGARHCECLQLENVVSGSPHSPGTCGRTELVLVVVRMLLMLTKSCV